MKTMNHIYLLGNLANDPKLKEVDENLSVMEMTVVTDRLTKKGGEKEQIGDFHKVVAWKKLAELANKFLKKGSRVLVVGKLVYSTYNNKEGKVVKKSEIHAEEMKFFDFDKEVGTAKA